MYKPSSYGSGGRSNGSYGGGGSSMGRYGGQGGKTDDIELKKPVWNSSTLRPFEKDFYQETSLGRSKSSAELHAFFAKNAVTVSGDHKIKPVLDFGDIQIPDSILNQFRMAKYDKPTSIQSLCWPTLLTGSNLVGIAQTGSGKTLGFLLPILIHIANNQRYIKSFDRSEPAGPLALVLAPTRELAQQIQQVAEEFGNYTGIRNVVIYGGASRNPQMHQLRRGPEICIATPGRLLDFLSDNSVSLHRCTFLVLDEADRMLDMGFEPQIRKIIEQVRPDRQLAMFSATWPREVRKLAEDFLVRYIQINIGAAELTANPNIKQIVEVCEERDKEEKLKSILAEIMNYKDSKVIIFAETKRRVDQYSKYIRDLGYFCLAIHGDKKQNEREWVMGEFKRKQRAILIATDVAARGINIEDIKYVINIDYPNQTEDYIHRIGRTARSTNTGTSYTLLTSDNARHLPKLIEVLKESNQFISDSLMQLARNNRGGFGGNRYGGNRYGGGGGGYNFRSQGNSNYSSSSSYGNGGGGMMNQPQKRSYTDSSRDDYNSRSSGSTATNGMSSYGPPRTDRDDRDDRDKKRRRWDNGPEPTNQSYSTAPPASYSSYGPPKPPMVSSVVAPAMPPTNGDHLSHLYNMQYMQALAAANSSWQSAPPAPAAAATY